MAAVHQVVIIGASFGGIPAAHGLLKDVLPALSTNHKQTYKVVMISPSDKFYWKIGSPRAIVNPAKLPMDKVLVPIAEGFKNYPKEKFEFIQAYANSIDPTSHTIQTSTSESIHYDSLIISSGTAFGSPLWHTTNGSDALSEALKDIHTRLPGAKSVVVAGGGPAGVETAGELGETYGGQKEITFLSGGSGLLPRLANKNVGKDAEQRLSKMQVKVINDGVKVTSATVEAGKTILALSSGTTMSVDVYIDATGDRPNNKFIPKEWLNDKGYLKTDPQTLRLEVPDVVNVYGYGTIASYSDGSVLDTKYALKPLLETIRLDLLGQEPGKRTKNVYKKIQSDMQFVPVGSTGGVGVVFGWKIPSFLVKMAKSKDFMIGNVPKLIEGTG